MPLRKGVRILATHLSGLIAFEKPPGLLTHPNERRDGKPALLEAEYDHTTECYRWDNEGCLFLVHRLDSPTSGILLGALTSELAAAVKKRFAAHRVFKRYFAVVIGKPHSPQGFWQDRILKRHSANQLRVQLVRGPSSGSSGFERTAKTKFTQLAVGNGTRPLTLLSLEPLTGRTHQLRIQCAQHQLPILGDRTYGDFAFNRKKAPAGNKRLFLHAADLAITFDFKGQRHNFSAAAPLPSDFQSMLSTHQIAVPS